MSRTFTQVNFRVPKDLLEQLRSVAAENERSLTETLQHAIEASVEKAALGDPKVKLQVRMPLSLSTKLTARAQRSGRSLNGEIVRALSDSLE